MNMSLFLKNFYDYTILINIYVLKYIKYIYVHTYTDL